MKLRQENWIRAIIGIRNTNEIVVENWITIKIKILGSTEEKCSAETVVQNQRWFLI